MFHAGIYSLIILFYTLVHIPSLSSYHSEFSNALFTSPQKCLVRLNDGQMNSTAYLNYIITGHDGTSEKD